MSASVRLFTGVLLILAVLCVVNAVQHKAAEAKAQVSVSIDRIGPDWQPPAGQG